MPERRFADVLEEAMQRRGLRNIDLSRAAKVDPAMVGRWRKGEALPSPESCNRVAPILGLPRQVLLETAGHYVPDTDDPADPERELMLAEFAEIMESYERSQWRDLLTAVKGVAALTAGRGSFNMPPGGSLNTRPGNVKRTGGGQDGPLEVASRALHVRAFAHVAREIKRTLEAPQPLGHPFGQPA